MIKFLFVFSLFCASLHGNEVNRYILTPERYVEKLTHDKSVFLAGSAAYKWRDEFRKLMEKDNVVLLDPINYELQHQQRENSLMWEVEHIEKADILLTWIPQGDRSNPHTLSLTTLFELGRFAEMKNKPLFVGISPDHHMQKELTIQMGLLRPDAVVVHSLQDLANELRKTLH